jgi:6-phospho-beta-glucosidase
MGIRRASYMRTDVEGEGMPLPAPGDGAPGGPGHDAGDLGLAGAAAGGRPGGYEGVALAVIAALTGRRPASVIVNTRNGASLPFLDPDDVVEVPAHIDGGGVAPLAGGTLPRSARGLVTQVKEYEREVVSAAVTGDAERAALALALHPLVPGVTVAREMMSEYRERHGPDLAYLH